MVDKTILFLTIASLAAFNQCQAANSALIILTVPTKLDDQFQSPDDSCEDVDNNVSLNLRNSGLRSIDSAFLNAPDVNCLSLDDNEISYVSADAFQLMPNLSYVNLARNQFSLANLSDLAGHSQLRTLNLDECNSDSAGTFSLRNEFPRLNYLYLRNNSLEDVSSLAFAPRLAHLDLASNSLGNSELSFLDEPPKRLRLLDLSDNSVGSLNASKLTSLRVLRLDGNRIGSLCGKSYCQGSAALVLGEASQLEILLLARNELESIEPDALDDAERLEVLDLSHNKISSIRKATFEFARSLRNLSLESNLIAEMPDLDGLESMEFLWLSDNRLEAVTSESFASISRLKFVDLSNNRIKTVEPAAFSNQIALELLDLSNNKLMSFPDRWFIPLLNLKTLFINGNELRSLDDVKLDKVQYLWPYKLMQVYLQNNSLTKFYTSSLSRIFNRFPKLTIEIIDDAHSDNLGVSTSDAACNCNCDDKVNEVEIF